MGKPRILFVDDEPNILHGLRRMLRRKRNEWDIIFVSSGAEALRCLEKAPVDIVVSDMRMPEMDGAELLSRVMKRYPESIRFILSGFSDEEATKRSLPAAHQYMSKPCDGDMIVCQISRALSLKAHLTDSSLTRLISGVDSLPSAPKAYQELRQIAQSGNAGTSDAARIISRDVGMAAKVLQLVNSSFFGLARQISSVRQASALLGMQTLTSLVISAEVFRAFATDRQFPGFSFERFCDHCSQCAVLAKRIALDHSGDEEMAEHAFTAGLLHDVGKLILAARLPREFEETLEAARSDQSLMYDVEMSRKGFSHAAIGAFLLGLWSLPLPVLNGVAFHHAPQEIPCTEFGPAVAVYIANILVQESEPGLSGNHRVPEFNEDFIRRIGIEDQIERWKSYKTAATTAM